MALEDFLQRTKSASFRYVLLSVSLGTDRRRRFLSSLDRKLLVCFLDQWRVLSEISSWDDCDIGSGVHSKVNLFAVDQDFCVPRVLGFQTEAVPLDFALFLESTAVMTPNMTSSSSSSLRKVFLERHIAA